MPNRDIITFCAAGYSLGGNFYQAANMRINLVVFLSTWTFSTALLLFPLSMPAAGKEPKWQQIIVLQSTRADVERLLGKSADQGFLAIYPIEAGSITVEYSLGLCGSGQAGEWNVPEWTVVGVTYTPFNNPPKLSSFDLDLTKFKTERESPCVPDMVSYVSDSEGVAYTVESDGTVHDIRYFPRHNLNTFAVRSMLNEQRAA